MGAWHEISTPSDRQRFIDLISRSHPIYAEATLDGLNRLIDKRHARGFIYSNSAPAEFSVVLLLAPDPRSDNTWKTVNVAAIGNFDPVDAAKIAQRQVRRIADEAGITRLYGTPQRDYEDPKVNAFYHSIPDLFWEVTCIEHISNDRVRYTLDRTPGRHDEDELFIGPRSQGIDVSR